MAKQRIINTRFWIDNYTANLNPSEKLLFLYFLTNMATEICGVYEIPLKTVAVETGIDKQTIEKILKQFIKDKKIFYIEGWVYIVNFTKHQSKNPSVEIGIKRCLSEVPAKILQAVHRLMTASPQSGALNLTKLNLTKPIGIVSKADEKPFSYKEKLLLMEKDNKRHIQIIALYWKVKKTKIENSEQYQMFLKRSLRPARELVGFSNKQITEVMEWIEANETYKWSLESVIKHMGEDFNTIKAIRKV